jgi:potassium-dependent mechanosensitive channel
MISKRLGLEQDQDRDFFEFWLKTGARLFLMVFGLLLFYLVWTIDQREALTRLREVFWDLQLGKLGISPAEIFRAIILFVLVLSGTRLLQQALDQRVFPKTRMDAGIRHSIRSALGYLGFFMGLGLAITSMGVDLSNLAILAGALSVGIGFGLQNIVNNFVSGLILLIERPIKTGDLISLGDQLGTVKKISVRATEITTGDNASLFVPNSSLISGTVVNRSRNGKTTKIVLPVHLAFDSELDQSIEKLGEVIGNHPDVLKSPVPTIHVTAVVDGSVVLDVVIYVSGVEIARNVTSELWRAIIRLFKEGLLSPPRDWLDYRAQGH